MLFKKLGVNAFLPMLCRRFTFSKSFQSDNHVYCDLNFTLFYLVLSKSFLNFEILLVVFQLLYDVFHQVDY